MAAQTEPSTAGIEDVNTGEGEQVVTPWEAHAGAGDKGIDYEKLISEYPHICMHVHTALEYNYYFKAHVILHYFIIGQFGSQRISDELLAKIETVTKRKVHHFLRRGIFFSHRFARPQI